MTSGRLLQIKRTCDDRKSNVHQETLLARSRNLFYIVKRPVRWEIQGGILDLSKNSRKSSLGLVHFPHRRDDYHIRKILRQEVP